MSGNHPFVDLMPQEDRDALARYNAECARGIVHTKAWDAKMAGIQRSFDENERRRLIHQGERIERSEGPR